MCRRLALLVVVAVSLAASGCGASLSGSNTANGLYIGTFSNPTAGTSGEMTMIINSTTGTVNGVVVTTTKGSIGSYSYSGTLSSNGNVTLLTGLPGVAGQISVIGTQLTGFFAVSNTTNQTFSLNVSTNGSLAATTFPGAYIGSFTNNLGTDNGTLIIDANGNIFGAFDTNTLNPYDVTGTISTVGLASLTGDGDTYTGTLTVTSGALVGASLKDSSENTETLSMPVQN